MLFSNQDTFWIGYIKGKSAFEHADSDHPVRSIIWAFALHSYTLQPLYNTVCYNTVLDITRLRDGSQKCIDYIEKWP